MDKNVPAKPPKSVRITLTLNRSENRLDTILLAAIRAQNENLTLREISRLGFKKLFQEGRIQIKGQNATPSSKIAAGTTYIDILGF